MDDVFQIRLGTPEGSLDLGMVETLAEHLRMERKALVAVTGEAQYGPVGVTPRMIVLQRPPDELRFDPAGLLAFRRSSEIAREGESAAEAVARARGEHAAGA